MGERAKVILNEYSAKNLLMRDTLDLDKFYTADLKLFVEVARKEIERLNNIIKELDKQNGELGAKLSIIKDRIDKTNWWLEQMLKQATNNETKAIINGTLELLLGSE